MSWYYNKIINLGDTGSDLIGNLENIFVCWDKTLEDTIQNNISKSRKFSQRSSILAKDLSLRFTVILLMILKFLILKNFTEAYSKPSGTSEMEHFAKIVNGWKLLTAFGKRSILDAQVCSEYAFALLWFYDVYYVSS